MLKLAKSNQDNYYLQEKLVLQNQLIASDSLISTYAHNLAISNQLYNLLLEDNNRKDILLTSCLDSAESSNSTIGILTKEVRKQRRKKLAWLSVSIAEIILIIYTTFFV